MIWASFFAVMAVRLAVPAYAEIQNDAVGFSTNHVFESAQAGENVDVMTGNLTLTIPLGPRYKLTDRFSYGVTLTYNSKVWEHDCRDVPEYGTPEERKCHGQIVPPTAYGLGFNIWPARVYHKSTDKVGIDRLVMEDGSEHFVCNESPYQSDCLYGSTPDNSGISANVIGHSAPGTNGWEVYPGDGRRIELKRILNPSANTYLALVSRIESVERKPDGSAAYWVNYNYSTGDALSSISDSQGRQITFTSGYQSITIGFPSISSTGSETYNSTAKANYTLRLGYHYILDPSDGPPDRDGYTFLESIELPGLNPDTESYKFKYSNDDDDGDSNTHGYGWMSERTIPTGAKTNYHHWVYFTSKNRPYHTELVAKQLTSGGKTYRWTWTRLQDTLLDYYPNAEGGPYASVASYSNPYYVRVLDPFDNLTVYRFHATPYRFYGGTCTINCATCFNGECPNNWDDGLLYEVATYAGPQQDSNRLVRKVNYDWDVERSFPIGDPVGVPKMFQYRDPKPQGGSQFPSPATTNAIPVRSRQTEERVFSPPGSTFAGKTSTSRFSEFVSGRPMRRDDYLGEALYRTTFTDRTPRKENLDAHRSVEVRDSMGRVLARVERCFDDYGRLAWEVQRKAVSGTAPGNDCEAADPTLVVGDSAIINHYNPDSSSSASGLLASVDTRGGDDPSVPPRVETFDYLYQGSYLKNKSYGTRSWKTIDRLVDFNTGLTYQTKDPSGIPVNFEWDSLGRLTKIVPRSPEKPTAISYPNLRQSRVRQDSIASGYSESIYDYDDLGRLVETRRRNIDDTYDVQFTEYDVANRVLKKSEWALESTPSAQLKWTVFDYRTTYDPVEYTQVHYPDPLGRIHGVTTPDDTTPETPTRETNYYGNTTVVTVRDVRGAVAGVDTPLTSTTVYLNDELGRLVSVDSPGNGADAQYTYDESDRLVDVRLSDSATPAHEQFRHFEYDSQGHLRLAANPENGTVQYSKYDARGNLLEYTDARGTTFNMAYDDVDRLGTKRQNPGDLLLQENTYDQESGSGASTGKLVRQKSYEVAGTQSTLLTDTRFGYGDPSTNASCATAMLGTRGSYGLNGRMAWQTTSISGWGLDVRSDFCQDELGLRYLIAYPDTSNSGRTRTKVALTYKNGYMWEMHDLGRDLQYIRNVKYAPGGVPTELMRGNQLIDQFELDDRKRPSRFKLIGYSNPIEHPPLEGVGTCGGPQAVHPGYLVPGQCEPDPELVGAPTTLWDSGAYGYDMAGNVKSIGLTQQYYYDELSRLTRAVVPGPSGTMHDIAYTFDPFGNMTMQQDTVSGQVSKLRIYTVDSSTNRLGVQTYDSSSIHELLRYTFDAAGNMTSEGTRGFLYDAQGRLRDVMDSEAGRIGGYHYDASGYRVRAETDTADTFYLRNALGQVLSEFKRRPGSITDLPAWNRDYVYALGKSFSEIQNDIPKQPKWLKPSNVQPGTPIDATHSVEVPGQATVQWLPQGEPDLLGYSIVRKFKRRSDCTEISTSISLPAGATGWANIAFPPPSSSEPTCGNIAEFATTVKYTIQAMDTAGNLSEPLTMTIRPSLDRANPPAPASLNAVASNKAVTLTWPIVQSASGDIWGYAVERADSAAGPFVRLNDTDLLVPEFYDYPLQNGQTYWYQVRATNTSARQSAAAGPVQATPSDLVPPGPVVGVKAVPSRTAGSIDVSWKASEEADVASYEVYRNTSSTPTGGSTARTILSGTTTSITDPADQGVKYYYVVKVLDTVGNRSLPSTEVTARSRRTDINPPVLSASAILISDHGTPNSTDGIPPHEDYGDIGAEYDDVVHVDLSWSRETGVNAGHTIYRKASDESEYSVLARLDDPAITTFSDTTITKTGYSYFVAGKKVVTTGVIEEGGGSSVVTVSRPYPGGLAVRNICMVDGRDEFSTDNGESRLAYLSWARVTEPGLKGYNLYRKCHYGECRETVLAGRPMDTFACEPEWVRVNAALIPPDTRWFADSTVGGLMGCFMYAVRPVGPDLAEGPITKIVESDLRSGQTSGYDNALDCDASHGTSAPDATFTWISNSSQLQAINGQLRGTASPDGPPAKPTGAQFTTFIKPTLLDTIPGRTRVAQLTWSLTSPPSDLRGFHVEMAGSPNGPWTRLTKTPIAWWERQYTAQGLETVYKDFVSLPHRPDCMNFRVLSVDDQGNESAAELAVRNPPSTANCPATPPAPQNLRATSLGIETPTDTSDDKVRLEWDSVGSGVEYYVYRLIDWNGHFFFYQTQVTTATSFIEDGKDTEPEFDNNPAQPNTFCPAKPSRCDLKSLEAYYVTARYTAGTGSGESPRSNLLFWKWNTPSGPGYDARLDTATESFDAVAAIDSSSLEELACWQRTAEPGNEISADLHLELETELSGLVSTSPGSLAARLLQSAPMRTLGASDPPWVLFDLHTDHLGTVRVITDNAGAVVSTHDYYPFGEVMKGMASFNTHQFTGHERDGESGLDYMLGRYYEPSIGRFITTDPGGRGTQRGHPQTWNQYVYVRNSPMTRIDPDGETDIYIGGAWDSDRGIVGSYVSAHPGSDGRDVKYFTHGQVKEAIAYANERIGNGQPLNIIGHSWGASAAVKVAKGVKGTVNTLVGVDPVSKPLSGAGARPANVQTVVTVDAHTSSPNTSDRIEAAGVKLAGRPEAFTKSADVTVSVEANHEAFEDQYNAETMDAPSAAQIVDQTYAKPPQPSMKGVCP